MATVLSNKEFCRWLSSYRSKHHDILKAEPEFRTWLDNCYKPLAGGWRY